MPTRLPRLAALTAGLLTAATLAAAEPPKTKQELRKELRQKLMQEKKAEAAKAAAQAKLVEAPKPAPPAVAAKPAAVAPAPRDATALARLIDQHVDAKLAAEKGSPSPRSTDAEFLRRVSLDITGVIPSADKTRAFLDSTAPDKRAKLIDELLADERYGRHQADLWDARLMPRDSTTRFVPREPFQTWLADSFNKNTPWDRFVTDVVTASGPLDENPAVGYFLLNRTVDKLTDGVSRHFLGVQLQCAQCHNHPFTETKQAEYWGVAAFFSKVVAEKPKNTNKTGADNTKLEVKEGAVRSRAKDFFPESAKVVPAKYLGGEEAHLAAGEAARPALAKWMTSPDNPFFARAMANRTWGQLFGAGIIDPVDDIDGHSEPSHPELLNALAAEFARSGFDVKHLIRGVCLSDAYQRSSRPASASPGTDPRLLAHMTVKMMSPEQLFDSLALVTRNPAAEAARAKKDGGAAKKVTGPRDQFVQFYLAGAEEAAATEYEAGIPQALKLMNSRLGGGPATVRSLVTLGNGLPAAIESIYLATLSRRPTADETSRLTAHVRAAKTPADGLGDVLWAVLNSSEFTMVR